MHHSAMGDIRRFDLRQCLLHTIDTDYKRSLLVTVSSSSVETDD